MLRPRKEPDPLSGKRKLLAERERLLAERMNQLNDQLARGGADEPSRKAAEPPVWRLEDDGPPVRTADPTAVNRRGLARQRQRDMMLFFVMITALIVLVLLVLALVHSRATGAMAGA